MSDIKNKLDFLVTSHKKLTGSALSYEIAKSYIDLFSRVKNKKTLIQSSVMRNGDWYQFFVHESGIHKIDRNFLENLGVNVQLIDPRKIRIFGKGGEMLTMLNMENYITDPVENSIKIIGEEDGSFDSED